MYVECWSGLASRIITLSEAYYLQKKWGNRQLRIIWSVAEDCRISFYDVFDERSGEERAQALVLYPDGSCKNYPAEGIFINSLQRQKSSRTGKQYPFPTIVRIPQLDLQVQAEPAACEQEMVAEDGIYSEYAGSGSYHGCCKGKPIRGRCSIEMIGNFEKA